MRIEIEKPGSEAFYKEVVSLANQYKRLQRKPNGKMKDMFKSFRVNLIAAVVLLVILLAELILWGMDIALLVIAFVLIILILVNGIFLKNMKATVANMRKDHKSVFIMDDDGIEVAKEQSQTVRMVWDKFAFVRCFNESVSFIPKDTPGFIMSIQKEYKDQVYKYLKEHGKENLIVE